MRFPPSVIVMSLVTALPFGLAIRDTVRHHDARPDDDLDEQLREGDSEVAAEASEVRARHAEVQAEVDRKQRAQHAATRMHELYGAHPASLGSLFDGLALGARAGWADAQDARLQQFADDTGIYITASEDPDVDAVTIRPDDDGAGTACGQLGAQLAAAWGPAVASDDAIGTAWVDAAAHQIAWLDNLDGCTLKLARTAEPAQLFGKGDAALVPLWAFGGPSAKLADKVPADARQDPEAWVWTVPGTGLTGETTRIEAGLTGDKITSLVASGSTDPQTYAAIVAQLTKVYGSPKQAADELTWARPRMTLSHTARTWLLVAGAQP